MTPEQKSTSKLIRQVGTLEGISYLFLLFVAMPLKYFADHPLAVKYTGWAHGVLFVAYMYMILQGFLKLDWSIVKMARAFIASLLPFGTIWLDRKLKEEESL